MNEADTCRKQRFSLGQRVMILRPNKTSILTTFLLYQLLSPLVQEDQIVPLCTGAASPHPSRGSFDHGASALFRNTHFIGTVLT